MDLYRHPEISPPLLADGHKLHEVDTTKWEHNPDTLLKGHGDKSVMLDATVLVGLTLKQAKMRLGIKS